MKKYLLKLYIAGQNPESDQAAAVLRRICNDMLGERYELIVIDVLDRADQAEEDRVVATPTLLKVLPPPARCFVGDFSDRDKVIKALELILR